MEPKKRSRNLKIYSGIHEPIISNELFEQAQKLTKEKVIKKRLYKEFLLSGLVKCAECGSAMTNSFSNKPNRRYYYYKCYKVMREGRSACSLKEVSAEKLELFLTENLSRIAQDKQYIESLAFKKLHNSGGRPGLEPTEVWSKNFANRVSQVLMNFKNKVQDATQVEKCLIFRRTIERINFSRDYLEVIISLKDTADEELSTILRLPSDNMAARTRGAHVNLCAPVCSFEFDTTKTSLFERASNMTLILPHDLLSKKRLTR